MARWLLLAASLLATGCGFLGSLMGGDYAPAPYMAQAAKGQPDALALMRESLGDASLNGTLQAISARHKRWPESQFEVIDEMNTWPITSEGRPGRLVDLATSPNDRAYPRIQIDSQRNEPWNVLTIYSARYAEEIASDSQWRAEEYNKPFDPADFRYDITTDPASALAGDIMTLAHHYYEAHVQYPADPAEFFTFCGVGVVERKEQLMLADYDVELLRDLSIPKVGLLLTPKRSGLSTILATCGPEPETCTNCGDWPQVCWGALEPGEAHGMQTWKPWTQTNIPRINVTKIVQDAGFSLPSDAPGSDGTTGSTGHTAPGND